MKRVLKYIWNNFEITMVLVFFILMLIDVFIQIFSRWVFSTPLPYTEELARYFYIWMVWMGFGYVTRTGRIIQIELFYKKFKGRTRCYVDIIIYLTGLATFSYLVYWSIKYVLFAWHTVSPTMHFSIGIVYMIAPVGFLFSIVHYIELIVLDIKRLKGIVPLKENII